MTGLYFGGSLAKRFLDICVTLESLFKSLTLVLDLQVRQPFPRHFKRTESLHYHGHFIFEVPLPIYTHTEITRLPAYLATPQREISQLPHP